MIKLTKILEGVINVDNTLRFIKSDLLKLKSKLIGHNYGNLEIESILNKALAKYSIEFDNGMSSQGSSDDDASSVYLLNASTYDNGLIKIEYEDEFYQIFDDSEKWDLFIKVVTRMLSHELVHIGQFGKIRKKNKSYKYFDILSKMRVAPEDTVKYLSNKMELMAFAREAVEQFRDIGYDDNQILNRIKHPFQEGIYPDRAESNVFWTYTEWFEPNDNALKKFLSYMYMYLKST